MDEIELGDECQELVTGVVGVAIGRFEYLTGCVRYELQPRGLKDGAPIDSIVFDAGRLRPTGARITPQEVRADIMAGGDQPRPPTRPAPAR